MATDEREIILHNYIERVMDLQRARRDALSLADLKSVARELGMTDEDMAAADTAARDYQTRGLEHLRHKLWDEAVEELTNAVALNPAGVEPLYSLAVAHKERWLADGNVLDHERAVGYARQSLVHDPHHTPSYQLLESLRSSSGPTLSTMSRAARGRFLRIAGIIVLVAIVVAIILLIWAGRRDTLGV
jgi:tetratricopeptide (TPR) repeat protein